MDRYCFEQYTMAQTTHIEKSIHYDRQDGLDDVYEAHEEEETLGYWAIYDRKIGHYNPIAYVEHADIAQQIVNALNHSCQIDIGRMLVG